MNMKNMRVEMDIIQDFKNFLYKNEFRIKNYLYENIQGYNKDNLDKLSKTIVQMFIKDNNIMPFGSIYCALTDKDTIQGIILPFLQKEDTFLRYDVFKMYFSFHHLDLDNISFAFDTKQIDLQEYIDKLKKYGYNVKAKLERNGETILATIEISKKWFFGLLKRGGILCKLEFFKRPFGYKVYSGVSPNEVKKFLVDNGLEID